MDRLVGFALLCLVTEGCRSPEARAAKTNAEPASAVAVEKHAVAPDDIGRLASAATPLGEKYDIMIRLGWATPADKDDALRQAALFQERLPSLRQSALGKWAVAVRDQVFLADAYPDAMVIMEREGRGRQGFVSQID